MSRLAPLALLCFLLPGPDPASASGDEAAISPAETISAAQKEASGLLVHRVWSPYQSGQTTIRVLLPDHLDAPRRYPVLYILPVEAGDGTQYGNGLLEARRNDLHNKYGLLCVAPTFSDLPWYADHPTDPKIRQESYFLKVVVPFIDRAYPAVTRPEGRLLVGFSKSGWGAFSLLLRNPEVFGKAAAWDAPLMMERPDKFRMAEVFVTQENFEKYRISALLKKEAASLSGQPRLFHFGYGGFRDQHESAHRLMKDLKIPHEYRDGPPRKHAWESGWLPEAVQMLVGKCCR
ncbi:MAG: alpha/beta hydrolase-fold protein [Thermoguttaceae bacterium]|jgi:S-formylglutathione hydrolase FrmB